MPRHDAELRHAVALLHRKGQGQRVIAKELGISRKKVRTLLAGVVRQRDHGHSALPAAPEKRASQLDIFAPKIQALLDDYPDISAVRLCEELRAVGYEGGYTILKERLRLMRPKPKVSPVERFETGPGKQGQQDWSPYTIPFTKDGPTKLHCFSFILAFSRRHYVHFCEHEDQLTLERQHIAAFERFGGVPEEILYDGQKAVVLRREAGRPIYNPKFLAFATHYGFRPHALPPRTPTWKAFVSYCTSSVVFGGGSRPRARPPGHLPLVLLRRLGPLVLVEVLVLVVVRVHPHQARASPDLDGTRSDAQLLRNLGEREQPATTKPSVAAHESVLVAEPLDHQPMERLLLPGAEAPRVEDGRDLPLGVVLEQAIDLLDDVGLRLADLGRGQGPR